LHHFELSNWSLVFSDKPDNAIRTPTFAGIQNEQILRKIQ
jgi:hypothetical protein